MPDDLNLKGSGDSIRININEEHELRYWCEKLNISREELIEAVQNAGPMVEDVRKNLGK